MENVRVIEEIIENARVKNKQKSGILAYWIYIDNRYIINSVNISFLKKDRKEALNKLLDIQAKENFLFWAASAEGEKFYNENYNKIMNAVKAQQLKPWLVYEYGLKKDES